jgi:hypothetical protein
MAITTNDIKFRLSGGSNNTTPNNSLGGLMSKAATVVDNSANNLWDDVSGDEANSGDVEYRCFFVVNSHASLSWTSVKAWVSSPTDSDDDEIYFGIETALSESGNVWWVQSIADESTAPTNVSYIGSTTKSNGLTVGSVGPDTPFAVWVERSVTALASAYTNNYWAIKVEGDTAA